MPLPHADIVVRNSKGRKIKSKEVLYKRGKGSWKEQMNKAKREVVNELRTKGKVRAGQKVSITESSSNSLDDASIKIITIRPRKRKRK
jgi:hypothetical protein